MRREVPSVALFQSTQGPVDLADVAAAGEKDDEKEVSMCWPTL